MKTNSIIESKADLFALRLFMFLFVFMMSCSGVFGQTTATAQNQVPAVEVATVNQADSSMELIIWINGGTVRSLEMEGSAVGGVKQTTKKQLLQSGVTPNRILNQSLYSKVARQAALV